MNPTRVLVFAVLTLNISAHADSGEPAELELFQQIWKSLYGIRAHGLSPASWMYVSVTFHHFEVANEDETFQSFWQRSLEIQEEYSGGALGGRVNERLGKNLRSIMDAKAQDVFQVSLRNAPFYLRLRLDSQQELGWNGDKIHHVTMHFEVHEEVISASGSESSIPIWTAIEYDSVSSLTKVESAAYGLLDKIFDRLEEEFSEAVKFCSSDIRCSYAAM